MTKLPGKVERGSSTEGGGFARVRGRVVALCERAEARVNRLRLRIRPRVSLLTGSVLVLLSLYLPTALSCDNPRAGLRIVSGNAYWPGYLGWLFSDYFVDMGRYFYLLCLAAAAFTLLLLLASMLRQNLLQKRGLITWLLAVSGSVALFSTTDLFLIAAGLSIGLVFDAHSYIGAIASALLIFLLPIAVFRPEFWTKKGAALWTLTVAAIIAAAWYGDASVFGASPPLDGYGPFSQSALIFDVSLLPLGLWLCYGFLGRASSPLWPEVKRRLGFFYAGTVAVNLFVIVFFDYWGLISFLAGLYLIFSGYWQLRRAVNDGPP